MRSQFVARYAAVGSALLLSLFLVGLGARAVLSQGTAPAQNAPAFKLTPDRQAVLERISAASLRGHLSFIASDLLEGRATPSRGLDIAAEYIAAQFRRAGLEPVGDANEKGEKGYFQTANWVTLEGDLDKFDLTLSDGAQTISVPAAQVSYASDQALSVERAALIKVDFKDAAAPQSLTG